MSNISALFNVIKKCAKKGKLDSGDVIRAGILVASELDKASKCDHKGKLKRKSFSQTTQEITIIKQDNRCNMCSNKLDVINFDHTDGNRSNNSIINCQALCPQLSRKKDEEELNKMKTYEEDYSEATSSRLRFILFFRFS